MYNPSWKLKVKHLNWAGDRNKMHISNVLNQILQDKNRKEEEDF